MKNNLPFRLALSGIFCAISFFSTAAVSDAQNDRSIQTFNQPARLDIRAAGETGIRITLTPLSFGEDLPYTPVLVDREYPAPVISLRELDNTVKKRVGTLQVAVNPDPLTVTVTDGGGKLTAGAPGTTAVR